MHLFPEKVALSNGLEVELRPLVATDADVLHEFFMGLSDETRRHLRDDVEPIGFQGIGVLGGTVTVIPGS